MQEFLRRHGVVVWLAAVTLILLVVGLSRAEAGVVAGAAAATTATGTQALQERAEGDMRSRCLGAARETRADSGARDSSLPEAAPTSLRRQGARDVSER